VSNLEAEFNCPNDEPNFDPRIERELGCYVYVLKDRESIFYVGKGGGTGTGNDRVLHHLEDARKKLPSHVANTQTKKIKRIHEIWARGEKVEWEIIRYGLPDSQAAFEVEAALIDFIGRDNLTNAQGGHDGLRKGRLSSSDVYRLAAPSVAPNIDYNKVLIFNIETALKGGRSPYDATRGWWTQTGKHEDATHAIGVVRGVSRCVIEINRWISWGEHIREAGIDGPPSDFDPRKNWEKQKKLRRGFEGKPFVHSGSHELLDKSYTKVIEQAAGYWGRGNWLAVEFFQGNARLLRGKNAAKNNCN